MKKRILVIGLTERMGGVETFIYNTTRFSDKTKYEYDYLIHGTDRTVFENEIKKFYKDGNHFYFVPSFKKDPIRSIQALKRFYSQNGSKYDYVHLETGAASEVVYAFPFCFFYHIKLISHSHNGGGYSPIMNSIFRPILNLASSKRLACSTEAANWLFGKKKLNKIVIVNNGIDTDRFTFNEENRQRIRKKYQISNDTLLIGHIGRFSEQKNHKFILDVFKEIKYQHPNSKLLLLGVGELQNIIEGKVQQMHLNNDVIFAGLKSNTQDFYSAFDVFLMPSIYEGLPVVGIEAQSEGLPCFFSSNISNLIKITQNAHVLPLSMGPQKWAEVILATSIEKSNRNEYADKVSASGFSIKSTVKELKKIYGVI